MKRIGIIGGAGAFAGQAILQQIFKNIVAFKSVENDDDFPHIIYDNVPFRDFNNKADLNKELLVQLNQSVKTFHHAQCDMIAMSCNTLHIFIKELQNESLIPIYNLVERTTQEVSDYQKVGVICSENSKNLGLHKKYFNEHNIECVYIESHYQKYVDKIIQKVMTHTQTEQEAILLQECISDLLGQCDKIVLGCTELSQLSFPNYSFQGNILDSSVLFAQDMALTSLKD